MPKRDDIKKILLIGSGPIVIGQACEFDYSGTQACKALKEEGYEVVLVNSNPATIMTDPELADRTYIEPLTKDILHDIIRRERPDALLPTLGGQTALNLAMELHDSGILDNYRVEMIGAKADAIRRAEDRDLFKQTMRGIGVDLPRSVSAHTMQEAVEAAKWIGSFPLIIRPGFTMGGSGGGIAYNWEDLEHIVGRALDYSANTEALIEESVIGWKEYELEVMRDKNDNAVIICSIENLDPMGVHTGDSITVAPAQTLTDREYQLMRDQSLAVLRAVGVETGGSNVQWAVDPKTGRMVIIEMNPRVSRSSALASKATGFPIAKIATKLAVGYTLDEIRNDITRETPACFEPSIDYVVCKVPRFAFEKFPTANDTLTTQMKSVGETMSIGKTFKESFQKAMRSLEIGVSGFGGEPGNKRDFANKTDEDLEALLRRPNADRIFAVRQAFRRGWGLGRVNELTNIDPWFLRQLQELAAYEDEIAGQGSLAALAADPARFRQAKQFGYSDRQIAKLLDAKEDDVRAARWAIGLKPVYGLVDTCAAEFKAHTPYYYSTYGGEVDECRPSATKKIMILGGGPNRIGQGIEFDYCCVHASFALRAAGFETIMVNSNPETVSTDYDTSDKLYFEPVTLEDVLHIYERENCHGVIVQFGGQTPLNLAKDLERCGVNIIGTSPASIEAAEDRELFQKLISALGIKQPDNGLAVNVEQAVAIADRIGYPVLMRPSFVLGGRAMVIVYNEKYLRKYMEEAVEVSRERPVLIDHYLDSAIEIDVDCVSDGETTVIGAIMEHVELAGVHSGDSSCTIPTLTLTPEVLAKLRENTLGMAKALKVVGLMNSQFAIKAGEVYVLEVNPRASRTVPFVSKSIGVPLAKIAALVMAGAKLKDIGFTEEIIPKHYCVKEAVFPFSRFQGVDILLTPEMKSTGEVMGIDISPGISFLKTQMSAGNTLPRCGNVFVTVRDEDKELVLPFIGSLIELGFNIFATRGSATFLRERGFKANALFKINQGSPNALDMMRDGELNWIVNLPDVGPAPKVDEIRMRAEAVSRGVPITTTLSGLSAAVQGLKAIKSIGRLDVRTIQEYHQDALKLNLDQELASC